MRLGVIDWGVGGLDALRRLAVALPGVDLVYWSDAGFTPYGKVASDVLRERLCAVVARMGVDAAVLACNAASTVLADDDRALGVEALGVIGPGVRAALATDADPVGVLGGDRTIASGLHRAALEAAGRRVIAVAAQPLSAHVEAGRLDGPELLADLEPRLAALTPARTTVLACTHYPALGPVLARLDPGMRWLDPIDGLVADAVARWSGASGGGTREVHTTGDPRAMRQAAAAAFGIELGAIAREPA